MIHFDFTVSEADAENIFGCIRDSISESQTAITELTAKSDGPLFYAHREHIKYMKELILKMNNIKVD
jgi:hypothetical protein